MSIQDSLHNKNRYWRYRAINANADYRDIQEGLLCQPESTTFEHIALLLRQRGLQIIELQTIPEAEYVAWQRTIARASQRTK